MEKLIADLMSQGFEVRTHQTGSRYICTPPALDTDDDRLLHVVSSDNPFIDADINDFGGAILANGFVPGNTGEYPEDNQYCFRKGEINLIVITNALLYDKWVSATRPAKELNIQSKEHRAWLFRLATNEAFGL